jgi:hypothetical protein
MITMQKLEFLVWNGKQYVLIQHDWILDEIMVTKSGVSIKLQPTPKPEPEKK